MSNTLLTVRKLKTWARQNRGLRARDLEPVGRPRRGGLVRRPTMAELDADEAALRALRPEATTAAELELWQGWLYEIACERWIAARREFARALGPIGIAEWSAALDR